MILYLSIKHRAFQLHGLIVTFIQHIAVSDLLLSAIQVTPNVVSLLANSQVSSDVMCTVRFSLTFYGNTASLFLVSSLATCKVLLLKYPLRAISWSNSAAHKICAVIWFISLYIPAGYLLVDKDDVLFDFRTYNCMYGYTADIWKYLLPISALTIFIPNLVIIVTSLMLLREARKVARGAKKDVRWQGIMAVVLTAAVYSVSFVPYTVYCTAEPFVTKNPERPGPFFIAFYRVSCAFVTFNILSNFFIYSLTVTSFRNFLKRKFMAKASSYYQMTYSSPISQCNAIGSKPGMQIFIFRLHFHDLTIWLLRISNFKMLHTKIVKK